jgi:eukaryotic-like serine/threonine-protein kinase
MAAYSLDAVAWGRVAEGAMMRDRIGPYVVLSTMGRGGTGIVARCRHERTGGLAAVKQARDTSGIQRDFLRKEISMLSRLGRSGHPGVIRVLESGSESGVLWYAMEYIEGPDLASVAYSFWTDAFDQPDTTTETVLPATATTSPRADQVQPFQAPVPPFARRTGPAGFVPPTRRSPAAGGHLVEALTIIRRISEIASFIHGEGLMHGDLKPKNVLFRADGAPVLVDFGTALYAFAGQTPREVAQVERLRNGTPGYMAPEQIRGEPLDARCDLYAIGCILFELLVGRRPFAGGDLVALQNQHLHLSSPRPSALVDGLAPRLDDLVSGLLAKDPRERIGYAQDVIEILAPLLDERNAGERTRPESPRHLYRPRMSGRDGPLEKLIQCLPSRAGGVDGLAFVAGESGIGKTRLVNELGGYAVGHDMEVVIGQSADIGQTVGARVSLRGHALQPCVPLLHRVFDRCSVPEGQRLLEELKVPLAVLAPYEPTLAELPDVARQHLPELPHALGRARVFRSLAQVIRSFGAVRPLLLVLDDLHWADDLTLAFLQSQSVRDLADAPVLIVGTYRSEQVDDGLRALAQARPHRLVSLERLDTDAIRAMVKDMLASGIAPEGLVELLHRHSEGNPFFAAEYLHAIIDRGLLVRDIDRRWRTPALAGTRADDASDLALPGSLHDLLEVRMEGLSPSSAGLLELACVLGREFELDVLESFEPRQVSNGVGGEVMDLEELVARQILAESGHRRYRFVHDKLREATQRRIAPARLRALHATAAQRLEAVQATAADPGRHDAELGIHWAHAAEPARAFAYLQRSAGRAERFHSNRQAVELYLLAIAQGDSDGLIRDDAVRAELRQLRESLADLLVRMARHKEARGHLDRTLALAAEDDRLCRARLLRKKAQSFWTVHEYDEARNALAAALDLLGPLRALETSEQHQEWIEIQQGRFWCDYFARRTGPTTNAIIREMAEVMETHGTTVQRAVYYICAALDILGRQRYRFSDEAVAFTRKALAVSGEDPAHAAEAALARFNLGFALVLGDRRRCEEAVLLFRQTITEAERIGDATILARALTYLAVGQRRLGAVDETEVAARRALRAAEDAQLSPYVGASVACLAWVEWKRGEEIRAHELALDADRWWNSGGHAFPFQWLASFLFLDSLVRREDFDGARQVLTDLLDSKQHLLPAALDAAVQAASSLPSSSPFQTLSDSYRQVLARAQELGYV